MSRFAYRLWFNSDSMADGQRLSAYLSMILGQLHQLRITSIREPEKSSEGSAQEGRYRVDAHVTSSLDEQEARELFEAAMRKRGIQSESF